MYARPFLAIAAAFVLTSALATPAHAQLGKIGGAIKKKAKEAAADATGTKEEAKPAPGTPTAAAAKPKPAAPTQVAINSDVIDRMIKGMAAESAKRDVAVKYSRCEEETTNGGEAMSLLMSAGPEMEKINNDSKLSDAQKVAEVQRVVQSLDKKKEELILRRCGTAYKPNIGELEEVGAEASGFTRTQYGTLKERFAPFCAAAAKGGSVPPNSKYVYTEEEIAAMRPRCPALLASLKKLD